MKKVLQGVERGANGDADAADFPEITSCYSQGNHRCGLVFAIPTNLVVYLNPTIPVVVLRCCRFSGPLEFGA
jgi:hypothetical protein